MDMLRSKTVVLGLVIVFALFASACKQKDGTAWMHGISSFRVEIISGDIGSESARVPYPRTGLPLGLHIQAVDVLGNDMTDWDGSVRVSAQPGLISEGEVVTVKGGQATANVVLMRAFGNTRVWVEDIGTADVPGTFATGLSGFIWIKNPSLRDAQESDSTTESPFQNERITLESGSLVVTRVTHEGFYVTDVTETEWNSIYAFTFGAPRDLRAGTNLKRINGKVSEFLGFTELVNPSWEEAGPGVIPPPTDLPCGDVSDGGLTMEKREAALVRIAAADVTVCDKFPTCPDLEEYQQWQVTLDCGAKLNVITQYSVPELDPVKNHGAQITRITGTVRHVQFASPQWILEPRDSSDICCPTCTPALNGGC